MVETLERVEEQAPEEGTRRSFLGLSALIGAAIGALVAFPVTRLFAAPLTTRRQKQWHPVASATEFTGMNGEMKEARLVYDKQDGWYTARREERVLVREESPDQWIVFSTKCTHFGCGITWQPGEKTFFCPCHNGVFNADGTVKSGPPERPLDRYEARKNPETGMLEVREI
jgi:menaquinol-cytochrome c reductase iron-sulfur subunit